MAPPRETSKDRMETARELVKLFSFERYTYLGVSLVTAIIVVFVGYQTYQHPTDSKLAAGLSLFGSGGVVTFNTGRLLHMFNKVFDAVFKK